MVTKILLNTVRVGTVMQFAGASFDDSHEAAMIAAVVSVGGRVASSTSSRGRVRRRVTPAPAR